MRLSDIKGDKAFEVLADLLTPIKALAVDEEIREAAEKTYMDGIQVALRKHPKEIRTILAILDLEDPETYEVSLATLPKKAIEVMNDPDIQVLFTSQGQLEESTPTGSATENTVGTDGELPRFCGMSKQN